MEIDPRLAELQRELDGVRDLVRIAPAFFGFLSAEGIVLDVNELALEVIASRRDEVVGKPFWDVAWWKPIPDSVHRVREAVARAIEGNATATDIAFWAAGPSESGQTRWVRLEVKPMNDGTGRLSASGIDITEQKAERELREQFVAMLSHDLRNPLTSSILSAQFIERKVDDPNKVIQLARQIRKSLDRAEQMIRDLLDVSQLRSGQVLPLVMESCDLAEVAIDTVREMTTLHGDRFRLHLSSDLQAQCSPSGIRRIMENLCGNAVKYGDANRPVNLSVDNYDGEISISVQNDGEPIPMADQATLFDLFRRTESARRTRTSGWGLGLALVKGLAEAHRGGVKVTSDPRSGTTFSVKFPARNPCPTNS